MKHLLAFGMLTLGLALALASCSDGKQAENTDSEEQNTPASLADYDFARLNYALGASAGFFVKDQGVKLDAEQFLKGLRDAAEGKSTMNEKDCQIELEKYLALEQEFKAQEQLRIGDRFLDSMAKLPGVVRDSSGLLYRIDVEGTGTLRADPCEWSGAGLQRNWAAHPCQPQEHDSRLGYRSFEIPRRGQGYALHSPRPGLRREWTTWYPGECDSGFQHWAREGTHEGRVRKGAARPVSNAHNGGYRAHASSKWKGLLVASPEERGRKSYTAGQGSTVLFAS